MCRPPFQGFYPMRWIILKRRGRRLPRWCARQESRFFLSPEGKRLDAEQMNEACCREEGDLADADFLMQKGVIVRHLALPGQGEDSRRVLRYLHRTYGNRIYISLMNQYTPMPGAALKLPELGRKLTQEEYEALTEYAIALGVENGFLQEGDTVGKSFIPDFDGTGL